MFGKRSLIGLLALAGLALLSACKTKTVEVTREVVVTEVHSIPVYERVEITSTFYPTQFVVVTATPEPTPTPVRVLTVCMGQEPDTLFLYGGSMLAQTYVLDAIYDGPIDQRGFDYQPVILEKLPSLVDGDATIEPVTVKQGELVIGSAGDPIQLSEGDTVRPAGCRSADCEITYQDGELLMDQMVVTFTLKAGILWSDGEPLTAHDSVYSYDLTKDPGLPGPSRYSYDRDYSYEAIDDYTTVWRGLPGYLDSAYFSNFWTPLPEHQLGSMPAFQIVESEEASRHPLGWGPFVIAEWVEGEHITAVRNPLYFRADEGLPRLDKIVYRFVGEDPEDAIADLLMGNCDILTQDVVSAGYEKLIAELEVTDQLKASFSIGPVWEHLDFGINPVESYERPDFFEDVRVRQAIAMCLDTQAVIDELLYGQSTRSASYVPFQHPLYNPGVPIWNYNPEAAQALLEEAGWIARAPGTFRRAQGIEGIPDGTRLTFTWQSTTAEQRVAYMTMYQENLRGCGIDVALENLPAEEYFADGPDGPLFGRHFDLASFTWLTGVEPPCGLYLCDQIPTEENGWAGQNVTGFCHPEYDAACQAAMQALPGEPEYEYYHKQAQRIFAEQLPVVPLFMRVKVAAARPEVCGFYLDPTNNSELWNLEEIAIGGECD